MPKILLTSFSGLLGRDQKLKPYLCPLSMPNLNQGTFQSQKSPAHKSRYKLPRQKSGLITWYWLKPGLTTQPFTGGIRLQLTSQILSLPQFPTPHPHPPLIPRSLPFPPLFCGYSISLWLIPQIPLDCMPLLTAMLIGKMLICTFLQIWVSPTVLLILLSLDRCLEFLKRFLMARRQMCGCLPRLLSLRFPRLYFQKAEIDRLLALRLSISKTLP